MTFSPGLARDPTERAGEFAARRIWKLLEEGRNQTGLSRSAFFTRTLRVWDALLRPIDLDEYLNIICAGVESAMPQIIRAFHELQMEAIDHYLDVLGMVYMLAGVRANVGEEYTPWSLVRLLVRLQMVHFIPPEPAEPSRTFYDPCCGSGTLLLGQMEYLDCYHPEVLDRDQAHFFGQDLSYDAWLMARINLRIHMLGRHLRRYGKTMLPTMQAGQPEKWDQSAIREEVLSPSNDPLLSPALATPSQKNEDAEPPDGLASLFRHVPVATAKKRPRQQMVQPTLPGFSLP